ncbi:cytochrome c oxidase subunit II [Lacunimicrobium album]
MTTTLLTLLANDELVPKWANWNMFPESNSTFGPAVDGAFNFIMWVCIFFFVLVCGLMVYFMVVYRRRTPNDKMMSSPTHNTPLEIFWTVVPSFLLVIMFARGFAGFVDMRTPPADCYDIKVIAKKWSWTFQYPDGTSTNELHVPVDTNVRLTMRSDDVLHSLYIPTMRVKMDVVPGRYTYLWFKALKPGQQHLFCTEYCGREHSMMITKCVVHPTQPDPNGNEDALLNMDFPQWLVYASDITRNKNFMTDGKFDPVKAGAELYKTKGCSACHSLTDQRIANGGPPWLPLSHALKTGEEIQLQDGSVKADDNYVRESILAPNAKRRTGYGNMPSYQGQMKDPEIDAIIAFIKSLDK